MIRISLSQFSTVIAREKMRQNPDPQTGYLSLRNGYNIDASFMLIPNNNVNVNSDVFNEGPITCMFGVM